jgi:site-specific DNA-methyltransferase (adenine-specific)
MRRRLNLICGDCLEELPKLPTASVDMILSDLPYGTTRNKWDSALPLDKLWTEYERVIKDNGVILLFSQTPFDKVLGASNLRLLKYEWIWQKTQGTGFLNAKKAPLKNHENILVFYKKPPPYFPQMTEGKPYRAVSGKASSNYDKQVSVLTVNEGQRYPTTVIKAKSDKGLHATQKPVGLCEYLIKTYTREGDTVLDSCMGSGTTGVAALKLGRRFIGIEKYTEYYLAAKSRIEKEINQNE